MEAVGFGALIALIIKIVTVLKSIGKDNNAVVTQALVWGVAVVVLLVASIAEISEAWVPPGFTLALGDMDIPSLILIAFLAGSSGSVLYDGIDALGKTRTSEPKLLQPSGTPPR